jgi:hypothetical protein
MEEQEKKMSLNSKKSKSQESPAVEKAKQELSAFVADHQLSFQGMFIPQKFSNNAKEDRLTLNWRGVISSKHGNMDTDYSKGIGHLNFERLNVAWHTPEKTRGNRRYEHAIQVEQKTAANGGKPCHVFVKKDGEVVRSEAHPVSIPHPTLEEVLENYAMTSDTLDFTSFESWAREMGYDEDSRAAEKVYIESKKASEEFVKVVGGPVALEQLKTLSRNLEEAESERWTSESVQLKGSKI